MVSEGDIVVCVTIVDRQGLDIQDLTIGKQYFIEFISKGGVIDLDYYGLIDDNGGYYYFDSYLFSSLIEYRQKIIKEILD